MVRAWPQIVVFREGFQWVSGVTPDKMLMHDRGVSYQYPVLQVLSLHSDSWEGQDEGIFEGGGLHERK